VPEDHQRGAGEPAAQARETAGGRATVVNHGHAEPGQVEFEGLGGTPRRDAGIVVVAQYGVHGREGGQLAEDDGGADVTGVQDDIGRAQVLSHPWWAGAPPPGGVGVRQHDDLHWPIMPSPLGGDGAA